ncbi:MAG: hypothetical protein V3T74_03215 [Gemmatimonadales bacterium]
MSQTRLRAWLSAVIWSLAGVGFLLTFFSGGGPGEWATDSTRHLTGAVALGFGFVGYWLALWFTRQREGGPRASDERDVQIAAQANQVTLIVVLVGIYAFTISLWIVFEAGGQVPVGWMWFLAYGSAILAYVTSSVTTLILDGRMGGHG